MLNTVRYVRLKHTALSSFPQPLTVAHIVAAVPTTREAAQNTAPETNRTIRDPTAPDALGL